MYLLQYNVKLFYTSYHFFHTFLSTCSQEANIKKHTPFSKYLHAQTKEQVFSRHNLIYLSHTQKVCNVKLV